MMLSRGLQLLIGSQYTAVPLFMRISMTMHGGDEPRAYCICQK